MSQMPPPPPGQPAPMGAPPSGTGSNKNLYTILAWALLPPIGSLVFLFVGKDDPDVKYNAAQAVVIHGGAFGVWIVVRILALQAGGRRVSFPVVGPMAQQYVPMVEGWAK